jgi:transcriptional regulatory protein LEU3
MLLVTDINFRFFMNYCPFLALVDLGICPNQYHEQSKFLFWVIVITGARRYSKDPTILGLLVGRVVNLALLNLATHEHPLQTITALLILCNWTFPIDTVVKDLSHIFGGAAMQIATRNGLHIFGNGQDFARTRLWPDAGECAFRAQLWSYCLFTCQRYVETISLVSESE